MSEMWSDRGRALAEEALAGWEEEDPIPTLEAAAMCLRVGMGEMPEDELDGWFPDEPECICPPDLVARGGFKGQCPAHSTTKA